MADILVTIREFGNPIEANLYQTKLTESGIQSFLQNEMAPFWLGPFGTGDFSIKLQVMESDVDEAMKVLNSHDFEDNKPQD